MNLLFIFNSIALGVGLAMDAFSVSLANGLREPSMSLKRMFVIAGTFAFFQIIMPLAGWVCVHTVVTYFKFFEKAIPWIALGLLGYIGGSMLKEGLHQDPEEELSEVGGGTLVMQGIATSIDALSVGFTIAEYDLLHAVSASLIIGAVTLAICLAGLKIGRQFGLKLAGKASILGGVILIGIGLEIFLTGIL